MSKYGLQPEDIGLHSTRKGAATFISSASPVCHYVALMLRAGWSLNVQDAYLKLSQGGDCLVGRQLAGLPTDRPDFCTMPPRFKPDADKDLIDDCIDQTFAALLQHNPMCVTLRPVLRVLLPSMLYARTHLRDDHQTIRTKHASLPLFDEKYDALVQQVWVPRYSDLHKLSAGEQVRALYTCGGCGGEVFGFWFVVRPRRSCSPWRWCSCWS